MSSDERYNDDIAVPLAHLIFEGTPGEDVIDFLHAVKRVAVLQGRQRDDGWMIDCVEPYLKGQAMTWFDALPPTTVESWIQARWAFLVRFEPPAPLCGAPAAATPTAIARPLVQVIPNAPLQSETGSSFKGIAYDLITKGSVPHNYTGGELAFIK
ncbi:hypothetical protein FRB97_004495, partial [Tulasnella sp. 331]